MIRLFPSQETAAPHQIAAGRGAGERLLDLVDGWCRGLPDHDSERFAPVRQLVEQLRLDLSRKPRVVLLGEFNSGKTSLANLLTGSRTLKTDVLSNTRVPVVVQKPGDQPDRLLRPVRLSKDGVAGLRPAFSPPQGLEHETALAPGRLLDLVTIIDTPGLSDPVFESSAASRIAAISDLAIWCSPATQAWKASEIKSWDGFARRPRSRSLMVLTGSDMLAPADRARVEARLVVETAPRFAAIYPIATLAAQASIDPESGAITDPSGWRESGGASLEAAIEAVANRVLHQRSERAVRWAERLLRHLSETEPRPVRAKWALWPAFARFTRQDRRTRSEAEALATLRSRLRTLVRETRAAQTLAPLMLPPPDSAGFMAGPPPGSAAPATASVAGPPMQLWPA